jgi:RNA polymerase sigma-70 factor (ECF subfamily)
MDRATEAGLVLQAQQGDHKAFEKLITPIRGLIYRKSLKASKDPDKADDIAQETMIRAYTKIGSFRGDSKFATWVYTICTRCILMHFRSARRKGARRLEAIPAFEMEAAVGTVVAPIPSQEDVVIANQKADSISYAMERLSPQYYEVIDLWLSGNSLHQIGDKVNLTVTATKSRIHRARKQIKRLLEVT